MWVQCIKYTMPAMQGSHQARQVQALWMYKHIGEVDQQITRS